MARRKALFIAARAERGSEMRALSIVSGICVLFTTLAYAHLWHHFFTAVPHQDAGLGFWASMIPAAIAGVFSLVGGGMLLKRSR
jgi:hypothetical protein